MGSVVYYNYNCFPAQQVGLYAPRTNPHLWDSFRALEIFPCAGIYPVVSSVPLYLWDRI